MALTKIGTDGVKDDAVTSDKVANAINSAIAANTAKDLTALSAANLTSGTIPDARFPATLPAASAANLTNLPANRVNRNLIINGAMQVAQRGTSVSIGSDSNTYLIDRFKLGRNNAGDWTMSQSSESPDGFSNSLKIDSTSVTTGMGVNREAGLYQVFEGQDLQSIAKGTSSAKEITVSFYIKCNKNGTYNVELMDNDNSNRHVSKTYTVSNNNWTKHTITFPADTTGAFNNDNGNSMHIYFWLTAGGQFITGSRQETWGALNQGGRATGQANLMDSASNEWYITGVQLEVGSTATDFEHRSFGEELALCQRYYQVLATGDQAAIGNGFAFQTNRFQCNCHLPVEMRTTPTLDEQMTGSTKYRINLGNSDQNTGISPSLSSVVSNARTVNLGWSSLGTNVTNGDGGQVRKQGDSGILGVQAEL